MKTLIGSRAVAVTPSDTIYITDALAKQVTEAPVLITSVTLATDLFTKVAHGLNNNDILTLTDLGTVTGTGIALNANYYVVVIDADTFKISLAFNGSAIDLTGAATTPPTYQRLFARTSERVAGSLYVGVSGDMNVLLQDHLDTDTTTSAARGAQLFKSVPVGPFPYAVKKVFSTSTTATNILCIY
jgi:hypothetical protein